MQDNSPCQKPKTVLSFLEEGEIADMKWSPQSPDMNPQENVWKIMRENIIRSIQEFERINKEYVDKNIYYVQSNMYQYRNSTNIYIYIYTL